VTSLPCGKVHIIDRNEDQEERSKRVLLLHLSVVFSYWKSLLARRCFFGEVQSRLRQLSGSTAAVAARPRRGMPSRCVEKSWMLVAVNMGAKGFEVQ